MDKVATQYAQLLMKLVDRGASSREAVQSIREVMQQRGHSSLLPRVQRAFTRLAAVRRRRTDAVLSIAPGTDEERALSEARSHLPANADTQAVRTVVDDTLIGAWRLVTPQYLVDASYKNALLSLFRNMVIRKR